MKPRLAIALCLFALLAALPAHACIWDRDTLAMEQARFPEVSELIAGYFPRHSPAYYQWRRDQVLAIPEDKRTPADYDDLGASYDKLGEHELAIQTILDKIERYPNEGLYETHANLGTFYIHNGDLEQGVQYIGSAIEINPDAHFGREVYQKLLVEYVIQQRATGHQLPLERYPDHAAFADFVTKDIQPDANPFDGGGTEYEKTQAEYKRAIKGILGMMRFGNYDSPVLLEALGDLLSTQSENHQGVQRLAARAYLKASYEAEDTQVAEAYRAKAERALRMQQGVSLADIEADLKNEIAKGDAYFAQIVADEKAWVAAGKDVDAEFQKKYYDNPPAISQSILGEAGDIVSALSGPELLLLILLGIVVIAVLVKSIQHIRQQKTTAEPTPGVTADDA